MNRERFVKGAKAVCFLTLVIFVLKIFGFVNWDWVWVVSPLWLPFAIGVPLGLFLSVLVKANES